MKQILFMFGVLAASLWASFFHPFWGLLPYYLFSILQPQALWSWALPDSMRWSLSAAAIAMLGVVLNPRKVFKAAHWTPIIPLLLAYLLCFTLSDLMAMNGSVADYWYQVMVKTLVMLLLTAVLVDDLARVKWLLIMSALAVGYLAWHFNMLYLLERRVDLQTTGLGALDNNGVAMMLAMAIPLVYAIGVSVRWWVLRLACAGLGVFLVHGIMLAYSRGAMLSAGVVGIWLLWRHRPRWQAAVLAPVIVIVVLLLAGPAVRQRFLSITSAHQDDSIQSRYESWSGALHMISDHPLLGMGPRNSNIYSANYSNIRAGRAIHNLYLQIAADNGLITLTVYLAIAGVALVSTHTAYRRLHHWNQQARGHLEAEEDALFGKSLLAAPPQPDAGRLAQYEALQDVLHENQWHCHLLLGVQASLVVFFIDSMFFSSEVLELAWLLMVLAAVSPRLVVCRVRLLNDQWEPEFARHDPQVDRTPPRKARQRLEQTPLPLRPSPPAASASLPSLPSLPAAATPQPQP